MRRCVSNKIIPHNLLADVDKTIFHNRCKPANSIKDNYSTEERQKILEATQSAKDSKSDTSKPMELQKLGRKKLQR